ncbi:S-adenosyl-L-methionine-dependent methyltransferase [Hypoxylon trugodes]|uniref:S-adenosyl-L-methionine-dependent methyltransferase n=1 Tax=Hypoxylon trugodes TaxID=326681 RepID=UPI002193BB44|nr:S-adenosyl-L-methionine-dependent methyltransferase [Hypoxylon trugodes]KAI1391613.1 S-adenosyl-L-methionine-dependent methyltransferase [Hypoxylon trugodes]
MAMDPHAQVPTQLISHFSSGWIELWDSDQTHFWDRGKPSPALIDWLESQPEVLPLHPNRKLTALVPGCGKGYDVVMLALHGIDVYGLELSRKGVEISEAYAKAELARPSSYNFAIENETGPLTSVIGNAKFLEGDFFKTNWEKRVAIDGFQGFDLIYDYTFLCALLPEMRMDWGRRMSELLSPDGVLVCLEFPLHKDLKLPGPPWGVKGVYWNILSQGGDGIIDEETASEEGQLQGKFKRMTYFKPARMYENGKGTDMFSVWKLRR